MTARIDVSNIPQHSPFFTDAKRLARLNRHVGMHDLLQAHAIAAATGCSNAVAKRIMERVATSGAGGYITLIYHIDCPDVHDEGLGPPGATASGITVEYPVMCALCEGMVGEDATHREFAVRCWEEVEFVMHGGK